MWLLSLPAGMFYSVAAGNLYSILEEPSGAEKVAALLSDVVLSATVALWVVLDSSRRGRPLPHIAGVYLGVLWVVLAPIYLFRTRGWRAFAPISAYLLICLAGYGVSWLPYLLWSMGEE